MRLPQIPVLTPCEPDHDDVQQREEHEPNGVCEAVPVELVDDEEHEDHDGRRVIPELPAQQSDNQNGFGETVGQQVKRNEELRTDREVLGSLNEDVRDEIVWITLELVMEDRKHEVQEEML